MKRTERGWAGHFIGANKCRFRRNTLLEHDDIKIVVSTVGLMEAAPAYARIFKDCGNGFMEIGFNRHYETMAFHAHESDTRYHDADVNREINFESPWAIAEIDADDKANEMHEAVVDEITTKLMNGERFDEEER